MSTPNGKTPSAEEIRKRLTSADPNEFRARDAQGANEEPIISSDEDEPTPRARRTQRPSTPPKAEPPRPPQSSGPASQSSDEETDPWDSAPRYEFDSDPEGTGDLINEVPDNAEVLRIRIDSPTNLSQIQVYLNKLSDERGAFNSLRNEYLDALKSNKISDKKKESIRKQYLHARGKLLSGLQRLHREHPELQMNESDFRELLDEKFVREESKNLERYEALTKQSSETEDAVDSSETREERRESRPLPPPTPPVGRETPPSVSLPEHLAKDGGTREMVREAKEAYLNQLASSKWGENHNRARKAYTVALETHLHAQMLLLQTDARIRLGEERLEAERRKKLGESVVFKDVEREAEFQEALENDPGYQRGAEKMAEEVVRVQNELHAEDPSFDATAAVTMNLELYALLAPHLNDVVDGPARAIFDAMSEQVFTPQEEEALKDTIVDMYLVQRAQYLAGYQAHLLGHSRPRESVLGAFTVEDSEFRAMQKAYKLTQKAVERMLKREGFSTEHLQREDTEAINTIRQYWLSGFKKARVPKTAEKVRTQKKGGIGRMAAAVLAFIAAWSHDPNAPQEPQVRFEQDMRGAGDRASEGAAEEVRQEVISVPAQRTGAIDTFSILLSQMTPEAREALYAGLEQSAGNSLPESDRLLLASAREDQGTFSHGALFVARQLGFVRENRREEPRIYRDSQFVFDESGIRVVRGRTDQLLVNSDNQKVADYRDR